MYQNSHQHGRNVMVLSDRIERAMNMNSLRGNMFDSENFQVMNYGIGGTISGHLDSTGEPKPENTVDQEGLEHGGLRISTFMIYLSQVDAGGHTVFPQAGVWVKPEHGDALFWFNVDSAGYSDSRNFHVGCPVMHGNKWIANKWIHWTSQMWSYPCLAKKGQPFSTFSNQDQTAKVK